MILEVPATTENIQNRAWVLLSNEVQSSWAIDHSLRISVYCLSLFAMLGSTFKDRESKLNDLQAASFLNNLIIITTA